MLRSLLAYGSLILQLIVSNYIEGSKLLGQYLVEYAALEGRA